MRPLIILSILIASSFLPFPAYGEDRVAENQALVQRLVLERAAAVASVQRIADEREQQLFTELAAKDRRLRAELLTRKAAQAELAEVTAERQRLVDEIAARDRRFAAEIEEYRRQVASIADSPDPRKREALKRYAEGQRAEAYDDLVEIQEAETKAVAAGWREIAALAQDRKDRGEIGTAEAIKPYEKAQAMDPDYAWGWIELRRLYQESGRLQDARRAAEEALARAQSDRDQAVAEGELGDVLFALGDLAEANKHYVRTHRIFLRMSAANPNNASIQRDLAIALDKFGNVFLASGNLASAGARFMDSLEIRERLAKANPANADAQRYLRSSLIDLGDVLVASGNPSGAYVRYERSLAISEQLAKKYPMSTRAQRDLAVSLNRLGRVLLKLWRLDLARARCEESLKIVKRLVETNPSSADAEHDLSVGMECLGDVLAALGDLEGARDQLNKCFEIRERLAAANPSSTDAQRDLIGIHARLGRLPGGEHHWGEALRIALDLQSKGRLLPKDKRMIDELRKQVAATEKPKP